jgi:tetratricopeptide (TPR) repeat protein
MMEQRPLWQRLLVRSALALVISVLLCLLVALCGVGGVILFAGLLAMIGVVWGVAVGMELAGWVGEKIGGIYMPSDTNRRVRPQFCIAQAHAKAGRYKEAIEQFRRDIEEFPDEPMPHIRIADLLIQEFHDVPAAITELEAALTKTKGEDAFVLASNRLADLALWQCQDGGRKAVDYLRAIQRRYPGTKHAKAAAERAARIFSQEQ